MTRTWIVLLLPTILWPVAFSSQSMASEVDSPISSSRNQQWPNPNNSEFMSLTDLTAATPSNLSIQYTGSDPITVTGIYIFTLTTNPNDCTVNTLLDSPGNPYGSLWAPQVAMTQNQIKYIGANYLYNMMMLFLYGAKIEGATGGASYTPGNADGNNQWCLWLGITNQSIGTNNLTCSTCGLETTNILVQYIMGDPPVSFTNITCNDSTRLCSTTDNIAPQPFPHQA